MMPDFGKVPRHLEVLLLPRLTSGTDIRMDAGQFLADRFDHDQRALAGLRFTGPANYTLSGSGSLILSGATGVSLK